MMQGMCISCCARQNGNTVKHIMLQLLYEFRGTVRILLLMKVDYDLKVVISKTLQAINVRMMKTTLKIYSNAHAKHN